MPKPHAGSDLDEYRGIPKKAYEVRAATWLLQRLGLIAVRITPFERPDVFVSFADSELQLGCEIQALHADDAEFGSDLREFHARWVLVMERVIARLQKDSGCAP